MRLSLVNTHSFSLYTTLDHWLNTCRLLLLLWSFLPLKGRRVVRLAASGSEGREARTRIQTVLLLQISWSLSLSLPLL